MNSMAAKEIPNPVVTVISKSAGTTEQFFHLTTLGNVSSQPSRSTNPSISISSNAMLNAMLANAGSAKSSMAGLRANTMLTHTNILSSVMSPALLQKAPNVQTILQMNSGNSSGHSRLVVSAPQTTGNASKQCVRTIVPPMANTVNVTNAINVTTSILQSTLSQSSTLLHTQLTSAPTQYKAAGTLPIDIKNSSDLDGKIIYLFTTSFT